MKINETKKIARDLGQVTFQSQPCEKCNTTTRYTKNGGCVSCVKSTSYRHMKANNYKHQLAYYNRRKPV